MASIRAVARFVLRALPCALPALVAPAMAQAQSGDDDFYRGKKITIVVGSSAGGGYDTYARMIARRMGDHIPGAPSIIVQNMPGAGGNVAANYVANVAVKDGTVIAAPQSGVILEPLIGSRPIKHDPSKAQYIGSANDDIYICIMRDDAPVKNFAQALTTPMVMAASAASSTADYPKILNAIVGAKFRVVLGYPGSREIALAVEKGEAQGACGLAWPSISITQRGWFESGKAKVLVQTHAVGHPDLNAKGVPLASAFAKNDDDRAVLEFFFSQSRFGRPYSVAPETPPARVALLRKAFMATLADPALKEEAAKSGLDVLPVSGEDLQTLVTKVYASPPAVIARAKQALQAP